MINLKVAFAALLLSVLGQTSPAQIDVRVGVVAYEDFHGELDHFEQFFGKLSRQEPTLRFQVAVGSYGELLHWMDRRLVDLAILTPGAFANLLPAGDETELPATYTYLATIQLPPATSPFAPAARKVAGFHSRYRSVCLVAPSSAMESVEDLRTATREQRVEFLFVHPLSVSGRVVPWEGLRRVGITPADNQVRFTYSHTQSLRLLANRTSRTERVAFVWDDAIANEPEMESTVRRLPFPELESLEIPHDVVVVQSGFPQADRLRKLLDGAESKRYRFTHLENWKAQFRELQGWLGTTGDALQSRETSQHISLDEISHSLLQYARSQPRPPRLALVLSGGGAKCSYQVGAVAALEERLAAFRQDTSEEGIDIGLVVGTSGGAINSVPIAMGISRTGQGREAFRETWCALDQRDIVRPSFLVRANMGLWFAILQTAFVIWGVRRFVPDVEKRGRALAIAYTLLAGTEILVAYVPISPWRWLGTNHIWHHTWLWLSFGVRASAWCLFAIGIAALLLEAARARRGQHIKIPDWFTKTTLLVGLLGLPLLQAVTIFLGEETLSTGLGMEQVLSDQFPALIDEHLSHHNLRPLEPGDSNLSAGRMQYVSRQVIERNLLIRDLVITGSCLAQTSEELPSDLYFFASADPTMGPPPFGARGVSLTDRPDVLLDVVMGSGSIFPVFPPRTIDNIPRTGEKIELVDGGFAHNSPVEAAVLWGATHIVLIEATPRSRSVRGNLLRNATSSFRHLHQQAQLLDTRSRGKVTIFSLSPQPPHICVLDFADNLIADSIDRGYRDASKNQAPTGSFRREMGEPVFSNVRY